MMCRRRRRISFSICRHSGSEIVRLWWTNPSAGKSGNNTRAEIVDLIENQDGPGPYGAKGAGEGGILAIAAAVGAAINEAVGVEIRDLPLTPERIWRALQEKQKPELEVST